MHKLIKDNYKWLLLFAISCMAFITNGDYLAVNFALVEIASNFHSTLDTVQWILSGYMLAWATCVIPAGKLLDKYDAKKICMLGVGIFMLASAMAGLSSNIGTLIVARVLQGVGGAVFLPTIFSMIYANFAEEQRGRAMGFIGLSVGVGLALGPVIGGYLVSWFSWQYIFYINLPLGALVIGILYSGKMMATPKNQAEPIHNVSVLLLALISNATLFALNNWHHWAASPLFYASIVAGVILCFFAFIRIQLRANNPLIPHSLITNAPYWGCCLGILLVEFTFSSVMVITGLYLQDILHLSSFVSGNIFLSMSIIFGIIAAFGGPWVDKIGLTAPTIIGLTITALGTLVFSMVASTFNLWMISALFMLIGVGLGLAFTGLNTGIVKVIDQKYLGIASSLFLMITLFGNALGVTISTIVYQYVGVAHQELSEAVYSLSAGVESAMLLNFVLSVCIIFCCTLLFKRRVILTEGGHE